MNNLSTTKVWFGLLLVSIIALFFTPISALLDRETVFEITPRLLKRNNANGADDQVSRCKCVFAAATFGTGNRDPLKPHGTINFFQNPCGQTSLQGEFSSGFQDTTAKYEFKVLDAEGNVLQDLTKLIKLDFFNNGAVLPFKATTRKIKTPPYGPIVVGSGGSRGGFSTAPKVLNNRLFLFKNSNIYGESSIARNGNIGRP
ncbi:5637_t:CDS:2 [Ambispora gerdemannii]|uniref:5637_t:CDS:1 n=1 Tax=Ambispora gerdemannii TaxID=144530 RepID=A0A9N9A647_9GLOM|nr:5637_t:CDS:2 [Ambispora gerdemannii]